MFKIQLEFKRFHIESVGNLAPTAPLIHKIFPIIFSFQFLVGSGPGCPLIRRPSLVLAPAPLRIESERDSLLAGYHAPGSS